MKGNLDGFLSWSKNHEPKRFEQIEDFYILGLVGFQNINNPNKAKTSFGEYFEGKESS